MGKILDFLIDFLTFFLVAWLFALGLLVVRSIVLNPRPFDGLMATFRRRSPEPERLVLFFASFGVALYYVLQCLEVFNSGALQDSMNPTLPNVPEEALVVLFGSQSTFVIGKYYRTFLRGKFFDKR